MGPRLGGFPELGCGLQENHAEKLKVGIWRRRRQRSVNPRLPGKLCWGVSGRKEKQERLLIFGR